jgi:SAM-dependent methyltransferase
MLKSAKDHFVSDSKVKIYEHDLSQPLPDLGYFDAVVSSFAIHHLKHERKREIYEEIYDIINPTGIFCNLENVASPSVELHMRFLKSIGYTPEKEDRANRMLPMEKQLDWLKDIGFVEVDCYWNLGQFSHDRGAVGNRRRARVAPEKRLSCSEPRAARRRPLEPRR